MHVSLAEPTNTNQKFEQWSRSSSQNIPKERGMLKTVLGRGRDEQSKTLHLRKLQNHPTRMRQQVSYENIEWTTLKKIVVLDEQQEGNEFSDSGTVTRVVSYVVQCLKSFASRCCALQ